MKEFSLEESERIWLISDTHFDHTNIIKYCNRPFGGVEEMNEVLLRNWNETVASDDLVYFLGDMAFGRDSRHPWWWVNQLNGKIVWVKGSHDRGLFGAFRRLTMPNVLSVVKSEVIVCGGVEFVLVHDTFDAVVNGWSGWMIHGHNHGNRPHIDNRFGHKRVNVGVEVINYKPISLAQVLREIRGDNFS